VTLPEGNRKRDLLALPKVDLHVHLEGSVRAATIVELADRHGAQGVRWAEASFSLPEHGLNTGDWDGPLEGVLEGLAAGRHDFGIETRVEIDAVRGFPMEASERAVRQAVRHRDRGVISIGLGGSERFPPEPYQSIFRHAIDGGLHSTPHAGEAEGPASIRGAIKALAAERLGHGIRILEDLELTAEVRDRGIPLEVCPTSNVATGVVTSLHEHPLPQLLEAGLIVTLNSDDPAMFASPIAGEYEVARRVFGMDDVAAADLARAGVRASFADRDTKSKLERDIDAWLADDPATATATE
jgi:adenosine deaminase